MRALSVDLLCIDVECALGALAQALLAVGSELGIGGLYHVVEVSGGGVKSLVMVGFLGWVAMWLL